VSGSLRSATATTVPLPCSRSRVLAQHQAATSERARQANERAREQGKPATYDESLLQFHTDEDLRIGLLGPVRTMKIRASRRLLIEKKALSEHPNPSPRYAFDKTIYYLFHDDVVMLGWKAVIMVPPSPKMATRSPKMANESPKMATRSPQNGDGEGEKQFIINELHGCPRRLLQRLLLRLLPLRERRAQTEPPWPDGSDQGSSSSM